MAVDVEQVPPAGVAVGDVRHPFDVTSTHGQRPQQDPEPRQAAPQPGGQPGVDGVAPAGAEARIQGLLDRRAGPQAPPGDDHQPGRRQDSQPDRQPGARRVEVGLGEGQQGRGGQPGAANNRQLVDQEAEPVAEVRRAGVAWPRRRQGEQRVPRRKRHRHQVADGHGLLQKCVAMSDGATATP
jgi:hypothetical protein